MPQKPDFTLKLRLLNIEEFSPAAISSEPRNFRPRDLANACNNVAIETVTDTVPVHVSSIARFVAVDFFALAHSSGLYNRQPKLWESLAKASTVQVFVAKKGFLQKTSLPEFDMHHLDRKGRIIAVTHYAAPPLPGLAYDYMGAFRQFLKRVKMLQGIAGVFLCYPAPFSEKVKQYVLKETNSRDAIQRFESILPSLGVPINLCEINSNPVALPGSRLVHQVRLVHPDLTKKKRWGQAEELSSGMFIPGHLQMQDGCDAVNSDEPQSGEPESKLERTNNCINNGLQ